MKNKLIVIILLALLIILISSKLYKDSLVSPVYSGLSTVGCIDSSKKILQNYTFNLKITIDRKNYPPDRNIGHDYGNCLREIYTADASGKVIVKSNTQIAYVLKDFFNTWKKTFNKNQIFGRIADSGHKIKVTLNGVPVSTYEDTPLFPDSTITVSYQ